MPLDERVIILGHKLARFTEHGKWNYHFYELAKKVIKLLEDKLKTDEKAIERLLDIDIAFEIVPYLSDIDLQAFEKYKNEEYNKSPEDFKKFFSPLEAYFWKWKYGFDIEKAYRWHKVKAKHHRNLSFTDILIIDKHLTPEEADQLLSSFDLQSSDLATLLEKYGAEVVKSNLKKVLEELRRFKEQYEKLKLIRDLQNFEYFYKKHKEIYNKYIELKQEQQKLLLARLINGERIYIDKDYREIDEQRLKKIDKKRLKYMYFNGTVNDAFSLYKNVVRIVWYDKPENPCDLIMNIHEINFKEAAKLLGYRTEDLKNLRFIIQDELMRYNRIQLFCEYLINMHNTFSHKSVALPINEQFEKIILRIPDLLNTKGELNVEEFKLLEKNYEIAKKFVQQITNQDIVNNKQNMEIKFIL